MSLWMDQVLRITAKQYFATSNFAHMIQRTLLSCLLVAFAFIYSCGPENNFNPCPKGKLPLADTVFNYESAFYEEPKNFRIFPNSRINITQEPGARFEINGQANLLSRFRSFQDIDTLVFDFNSCVFQYRVLDMNLVATEIESVTTFDSCIIEMDPAYTANNFQLNAGKRTKGTVQGAIKRLNVRNESSDTLYVSGTHNDFNAWQYGEGILDARAASMNNVIVSNHGLGHIYLPECDSVQIIIESEGNVYYKGNPRYLGTTITGTGAAIKVE